MVNLTDAFGVINLAGPNARKVLEKVTDADVSNEAFPYAGYREFMIQDTDTRQVHASGICGRTVLRVACAVLLYAGPLGLLADAGQEFGIRNFGLEAQNVLRMEKCHLIIGSESEQRTTLHDVGLGFLWEPA